MKEVAVTSPMGSPFVGQAPAWRAAGGSVADVSGQGLGARNAGRVPVRFCVAPTAHATAFVEIYCLGSRHALLCIGGLHKVDRAVLVLTILHV